ncbi:MAG: DNA mismatch repair endonuclease MutL [Dehalobacterium sp.]
MERINILDPLTANQIAAGEVVERPVSVVKELVENSIDAGSTRIQITLLEGGIKRIAVLDNGWGISYEDLSVAIKRHATSKLKTVQDLASLKTLGFRGEALPSMAAVSKMTITSRTKDSPVGYSLQVNGGEKGNVIEVGSPIGTKITIDDLFYNTPARKKFLKSPSAELAVISDLVGRIAMSRPEIAFELIHEKKTVLKTPGNNKLTQVIFSVYGSEVARNMKMVKHDSFPTIEGYVSVPLITRSSRHYYNFFLNGRLVKSQELTEAMEEAYHTRIPLKRYPIAVLFINISPDLFDVNVHPAKLEVKFKDVFPIKEALVESIKSTLNNPFASIPKIRKERFKQEPTLSQQVVFDSPKFEPYKDSNKDSNIATNEDTNAYDTQDIQDSIAVSNDSNDKEEKIVRELSRENEDQKDKQFTQNISDNQTNRYNPVEQNAFFSSLKVLGQIGGTYIIASGNDGLYIIDQHAAHERIRYEKIIQCFREQPSASSHLSIPVTIELTSEQTLWLIDNIVQLADLGFILEHFGNNTFLLRGVPKWHLEGNSQELLLDILEKLGSGCVTSLREVISEEKLFSLACKSAVKANKFLTDEDINFLLQQLDLAENPYTCPHGRPVIITITHEEIKKRFLRT